MEELTQACQRERESEELTQACDTHTQRKRYGVDCSCRLTPALLLRQHEYFDGLRSTAGAQLPPIAPPVLLPADFPFESQTGRGLRRSTLRPARTGVLRWSEASNLCVQICVSLRTSVVL